MELGKKYFSVASGGGTGRTLHPDNMAAGLASYGMTGTVERILFRGFCNSSSTITSLEMLTGRDECGQSAKSCGIVHSVPSPVPSAWSCCGHQDAGTLHRINCFLLSQAGERIWPHKP